MIALIKSLTKEVDMEKLEFKQMEQMIKLKIEDFHTEYDKLSHQVKEANLNFFNKTKIIVII